MRKRKGMSRLLIRFVVLSLAVYAVCSAVSIQAQVRRKREEHQALQQEYDIRVQRVARLRDEIDAPLDNDAVARLAREKLGLALPGERVFIDISR